MRKLIDQQEAIDALKAKAVPLYKDPECNDIWERDRTLDNAIDVIRGLPSVEPEVIRCKDCKWYKRAYKHIFYRGMDCLNHRISTIVPDKDYCSRAERRTDVES